LKGAPPGVLDSALGAGAGAGLGHEKLEGAFSVEAAEGLPIEFYVPRGQRAVLGSAAR